MTATSAKTAKTARQVHPLVTAIEDVARKRRAESENPTRFKRMTRYYADAIVRGEEQRPPSLDSDDAISIAAHIEALAGMRRIQAARHPVSHRCESCRGALYIMTRRVPL
ncbi:hypothetical protein PV341_16200 [Streptomyces sp. PA03-1a]|nr:hypothetical protein [Streptomyces sp. PA03-1a]MDX2813339.1 hypothetical protein [Streptomyces sp. PA03-5A]